MFRRAPINVTVSQRADAERLWGLHALPPATAHELEEWLNEIADLPLEGWLGAAEHCGTAYRAPLAIDRACKRIERIVAEQGLEFTAWLVRDLVDSATYGIRQTASRLPRGVRGRIAVARMAAEWAALAKACQSWLAPEDHDLLCAPFTVTSAHRMSAVI